MREDTYYNESPVNLTKIFQRAFYYWYYLPIFLILSIIAGIYIYKSTVPQYKISTKLLITDEQEQLPGIGTTEGALPGINLGSSNNIENQLIILTSTKQIEKTLKQLDFSISYFEHDAFKATEIYKDSPFKVKIDTSGIELFKAKYHIKLLENDEFILSSKEGEKFSEKHKFFEKINVDGLSFSILPKENLKEKQLNNIRSFSFQINPLEDLIIYYQKEIIISDIKEGASIFEITIHENNIQKGKDFLNKLAENSVAYTLDKKNKIADNTIHFIENQLIDISDSLNMTKNMLKNFRARNEMMDISMQGQMIIDKTEALELEKNIVSRHLDYYKYLASFLESNQNILNLLPPSAQGVENIIVDQMITELATMNADKQSLQFNSKVDNPAIAMINRQIGGQKQTILQQARSNITSTRNDLNSVNRKLMQLSSEIKRLPKKEQLSLEIEQKFQSTDRMHTYLMERRSEAQLAKASNTPDNERIEPARGIQKTKPDVKRFAVLIILTGIFIPFIIIFLTIYTNNNILDKDDIEQISRLPIIGVVPKLNKNEIISTNNTQSVLSESIRTIRTALEFYPTDSESKCILITSGLPNEGKSLNAVNLAISYAHLGKKTVLIDFDMRKPSVKGLLNLNVNGNGLSTFLAQKKESERNNLISTTTLPLLEVIPSGAVPPNPAELIAKKQTQILIDELKQLYDIIIIDSPPIGLVTDALLLSKLTDINILVTRHNKTPKPMLEHLLRDPKIQDIQNLCVVLNDLPVTRKAYNNYSYNSKYYS